MAINLGMSRKAPTHPAQKEGAGSLRQSRMISNEIRFDCQHRGDRGPLVVVPHIDGAPLTELIDEYEIAAGMQPAGDAYGGLIPEFFRFGPMQDHFLGLSTSAMGPKIPVLGCECGEWGAGRSWPASPRPRIS
ncbi:hypothetical protein ACGF1Z_34490 [Streptomyces sp. NPDC048018]|uniref:hypothetical protein n=1 Tax=Streptomyces sp. NPDC048018 TaxID=3365499 RepID=UPI00371A20AC